MKNKTKNNERLARNTIRARKANKKRTNEQDKPKTRKMWITRLFALAGCLLLVSALVVPCFADALEERSNSGEREVNFLEVLSSFRDTITTNDKQLVIDSFTDSLGSGFFDYSYFNGGNIAYNITSWFYYESGVVTREVLEHVYVSFLINGLSITLPQGRDLCQCTVFYDFSISPNDNRSSLLITFRSTEEFVGNVCQIQYNGTVSGGTLSGYTANLYLTSVTSDFIETDFDIEEDVLTVGLLADYYSPGISLQQQLSLLNSLFLNANSNEPSNPHQFYQGFLGGYSYGYGDGYSEGNDDGREQGYNEGYTHGYNNGIKDGTGLDYTEGYNQAIRDIEDGDFGRNFLSGIFNAPMDAMNEFVIASWETPGGNTMRITLGAVLGACIGVSIFVWFLKMFAGG